MGCEKKDQKGNMSFLLHYFKGLWHVHDILLLMRAFSPD